MRHVYECPIRRADLDMRGHVDAVTYVDYLQETRVDMLRTHGTHGHGQADLAEGMVVVRNEVTYLRPLLFTPEPVLIECWVSDIRAASFTIAYEIYRESRTRPAGRSVFARATTVLTPFVFANGRPRRISDEERSRFAQFLEPGERTRVKPPEPVPRTQLGHFPVHVRFSDLDVYGHVNNVKYFEYFQESRLRFLAHRVTAEVPTDLPPLGLVVAQTDVDYLRPILFRSEPYDCWSQVSRVGSRSFTLDGEIRDGDELLARAVATVVFVDPDTGGSVEPPEAYRAPLLAALNMRPARARATAENRSMLT